MEKMTASASYPPLPSYPRGRTRRRENRRRKVNECEREGEDGGGEGGGRGRRMTEERKRDEDGLSRGGEGGQRKEECIPGRVNPWGLEWLTIPWIRAFRLTPPHPRSWCAFPRTCNQRRGYESTVPPYHIVRDRFHDS